MTEYETADLAASYFAVAIAMAGLWATSTSGYLIVAYNAGANLSKSQVILVSVLFIFLGILGVWGTYANMRWAALLAASIPEVLPRRIPVEIRPYHFVVIVQSAVLLAGLKFMWDIKKTRK